MCTGISEWKSKGESLDEAFGGTVGIRLDSRKGRLDCSTVGTSLGTMLGLCEDESASIINGELLEEVIGIAVRALVG